MTTIPAQETDSEPTTEIATETPPKTSPLVDFGLDQTPAPDVIPTAPEGDESNLAIIPDNPDDYAVSVDEELGGVDAALNERLHKAGFNNAQAQLVYDLAGEIIPSMVEQVQHCLLYTSPSPRDS